MFAILQLRAMPLDYGTPGFSPERMLLIFFMIFAVSMIPYVLLYVSLGNEEAKETRPVPVAQTAAGSFAKFAAWVHAHRHPHPVHH